MERIILIETSTALCSTALAENGEIVSYRESSAPKAHASLTAVFIQEMLAERDLSLSDCDAICVSKGPGSYTGLRVGVSTAKGLCFGSGKPLLAVGTLDTLVAQASAERLSDSFAYHPELPACLPDSSACHLDSSCHPERSEGSPFRFIIPMIDARRMEVYTAVFTASDLNGVSLLSDDSAATPSASTAIPSEAIVIPGEAIVIPSEAIVIPSEGEGSTHYTQTTETAPMIIDENSFAEYLEQGSCLFIGDGAGKCADVIKHPNARFCQCQPKASSMLEPALAAFRAGDFKDVAYFEPFYLKEFVATVSKKKLW